MKQFTSHINFSLTRKRFEMMIKHFSPLRSYSKKLVLLPVIMAITLMFCTQQTDTPIKITGDNTGALYSTVELFVNSQKSDELNIENRGIGIRYDSAGELFTGTQQFRYLESDSLYSETVYENGLIKSREGFFRDGDSVHRYNYEYDYIGEHFKAVKVYKDGVLIEEWKGTMPDELGFNKQWYSNGRLKFEAYFKGNIEYEGLMTLYDENGEVLKQERYEEGELVETIK